MRLAWRRDSAGYGAVVVIDAVTAELPGDGADKSRIAGLAGDLPGLKPAGDLLGHRVGQAVTFTNGTGLPCDAAGKVPGSVPVVKVLAVEMNPVGWFCVAWLAVCPK